MVEGAGQLADTAPYAEKISGADQGCAFGIWDVIDPPAGFFFSWNQDNHF
jgi:hypothetical protein